MIHLDSKKILEPDLKSTEEIMDEKKKQMEVSLKLCLFLSFDFEPIFSKSE